MISICITYKFKLACNWRLNAGELITDQIPSAVPVLPALDLLAPNLLVAGVPEEPLRAGTDRLVGLGGADGIAAADDRTGTRVLALIQAVLPPYTGVGLVTV